MRIHDDLTGLDLSQWYRHRALNSLRRACELVDLAATEEMSATARRAMLDAAFPMIRSLTQLTAHLYGTQREAWASGEVSDMQIRGTEGFREWRIRWFIDVDEPDLRVDVLRHLVETGWEEPGPPRETSLRTTVSELYSLFDAMEDTGLYVVWVDLAGVVHVDAVPAGMSGEDWDAISSGRVAFRLRFWERVADVPLVVEEFHDVLEQLWRKNVRGVFDVKDVLDILYGDAAAS